MIYNTHFKTTLANGWETRSVYTPSLSDTGAGLLCGGGVGWIGMQVAGRHSFPGSSSLKRWLEIQLVCIDMVRGVEGVGTNNVGHMVLVPLGRGGEAD